MMLARGVPCSPGRGTGVLQPSGDVGGAGEYVLAVERPEAQHTALLRDPRCVGVVAARGSPADHVAILAGEAGVAYLTVPGAVVDVHGLSVGAHRVPFGSVLTVDATAGVLYLGASSYGAVESHAPLPPSMPGSRSSFPRRRESPVALSEIPAYAGMTDRARMTDKARATVAGGSGAGEADEHGNRYWSVDTARLLPVYRDLYERIFAERLRLAGVDGFVRREGGRLVYGGPDAEVTRLRPAAVARQRLVDADTDWIRRQDRTWRGAARTLEATTSTLRHRLVTGQPAATALNAVFEAKVALNALGVDSMLPAPDLLAGWLTESADEVVVGCYLPASGQVAFDAYERESLVLARDTEPGRGLPEAARARFVQHGLFYRHDALDPAHRERVLVGMPAEAAEAVRRWAPDRPAITVALQQVAARAERRRDRRRWAERQVADAAPRARALADFAGSARDFDETKRQLNMGFWQCLFMVADGLGVDLKHSDATMQGLCDHLERTDGLRIDPVFGPQDIPG